MNKLYTDWATIYDEIYQQLFDYNKDFAFYDSHLQAHNARTILELGCGTGHLALKFCSKDYAYTGIDMSANMLALAQARVPNAIFIESDIRRFYMAEKFDAVLMTGRTISYLIKNKDVIQTFECISKVLKSGGLLIFDAIDAVDLFSNFNKIQSETLEIKTNYTEYKRNATNKMNLDTGFTWDWATTYFQKQGNDFEKIGDDKTTLRAFTKDELVVFLSLFNLKIKAFIDKESYAWQSFYCIVEAV